MVGVHKSEKQAASGNGVEVAVPVGRTRAPLALAPQCVAVVDAAAVMVTTRNLLNFLAAGLPA